MGSLFIADQAIAARVGSMAHHRGSTETALVSRAMDALERAEPVSSMADEPEPADLVEWIRPHRARHPLPPSTGRKSAKAFLDHLWGDGD